MNSGPIDTSIVLATCNRAAMLRSALESLIAQDWAHDHAVDLVVVDDGSTDATPELLRELQHTSPLPITVLQGPQQGVAAARNVGSRAATGMWIASFDDDQIASPDWLRQLRTLADEKQAACIGGRLELALPAGVDPAAFGPRVRSLLGEHALAPAPRRYRADEQPATNSVLIRQDLLRALNGYDTRFTEGGEDKEFFRRVAANRHELWFCPASHALHVMPPRRLETANLRWTALRVGAADVRLDQRGRRVLRPVTTAVVRLGVALLRDIPQWIFARLRGSRRDALESRCSLWFTQGYLRALLPVLTGNTLHSRFMRSMDFRSRNGERASTTKPLPPQGA